MYEETNKKRAQLSKILFWARGYEVSMITKQEISEECLVSHSLLGSRGRIDSLYGRLEKVRGHFRNASEFCYVECNIDKKRNMIFRTSPRHPCYDSLSTSSASLCTCHDTL